MKIILWVIDGKDQDNLKKYTTLTFLGMREFEGLKNTRCLTDCYIILILLARRRVLSGEEV